LPQAGDEPVGPLAEVAEARLMLAGRLGRHGRGRGRDRRQGRDPFFGIDGGDARPLGQLGRMAGLLGGIQGRGANGHHRRLRGARRRQRLLDPPLQLADQRRPAVLGQQPVLRGVSCVHATKYGDQAQIPATPKQRTLRRDLNSELSGSSTPNYQL